MFNEEVGTEQALRWAMVGGGRGSQIGYAHRSGALRDGHFKLVAGAFDIDADRCRDFGINLGLDADRCYADYQSMFEAEAQREDGIQAVSIATPNGTHYAIAKAALLSGLHVVCEKPVTFTVVEAQKLKEIAIKQERIFGVMYGYTGFQMIHQAKEMIRRGDLGEVRVITMQFAHGFHSSEVEKNDPGAKWRMNPEVSGPTYVLGDVGTHAFYLAQLMAGLTVDSLSCMRQSFVTSRAPLEDNAHVMMRFTNGAVGTLWASGVNAGSMHHQKIRIVGEKASIEWWDERPNQLSYEVQGEPARTLERGMGYLHNDDLGVSSNRIGGGHAEGFFESWANLYSRFGIVMKAMNSGDYGKVSETWYPDIDAGIEGVQLLERCVESADDNAKWVAFS